MEDLKKQVLAQLDSTGYLSRIRAEIRSKVLTEIEQQSTATKYNVGFKFENPICRKLKERGEGQLCLDLIREFFDFFKMEFSLSTFLPEAGLSSSAARSR